MNVLYIFAIVWWTVPIARVIVGIVGSSPDCTDAPQALKSINTNYTFVWWWEDLDPNKLHVIKSKKKCIRWLGGLPCRQGSWWSQPSSIPVQVARLCTQKGNGSKWSQLRVHTQKGNDQYVQRKRFTSRKLLQVPATVFWWGSVLLSCTNMVGLRSYSSYKQGAVESPEFGVVPEIEEVHGLLPLWELLCPQKLWPPSPEQA